MSDKILRHLTAENITQFASLPYISERTFLLADLVICETAIDICFAVFLIVQGDDCAEILDRLGDPPCSRIRAAPIIISDEHSRGFFVNDVVPER